MSRLKGCLSWGKDIHREREGRPESKQEGGKRTGTQGGGGVELAAPQNEFDLVVL